MNEDAIYNLKLHDWLETGEYHITRFPGGWIYRYKFAVPTLVFIPFIKKNNIDY